MCGRCAPRELAAATAWLLLAVFAADAAALPWVVREPLNEHSLKSAQSGENMEFHGTYRDLSLWVRRDQFSSRSQLADVWVIEFNDADLMAKERKRAEKAKLSVMTQEKLTLVIQGEVPDKLGYDSCGSEKNKTVISVSDEEVVVQRLSPADKARYMKLAKTKDAKIEKLLSYVSRSSLETTLTHFQSYQSRNSYSGNNGLNQAVSWAAGKFREYGFTVSSVTVRNGITPQIVAELRGLENPSRIVVLGAHIDDRSTSRTSATQRAPGADDNGSGSSNMLEFARIISQSGTKFKHTLRVCLFTGEEQGLYGSRVLARQWRSEGLDVIGMFNADMIGYKRPNQPIVLAFMNRASDRDLTQISMEASKTYLPQLQTGITSGCCSDQQAFYENGFSAVGFFETPGSRVAYPHYHRSSDLLEHLDLDQIQLHGTSAMASAAVLAEVVEKPTPAPPTPSPTPGPPIDIGPPVGEPPAPEPSTRRRRRRRSGRRRRSTRRRRSARRRSSRRRRRRAGSA